MSQADTDTKIEVSVKEPPRYQIVYLNDEKTTAEFVTTSLIEFFNYTVAAAEAMTWNIHDQGAATVAVLPYELAEQKGIEITLSARKEGYPLQIKIEPEAI